MRKKGFRIKEVSFRSNVELKPYMHSHIEVKLEVAAGQDPKEALEFAKDWVAEQLKVAKEGDRQPVGRFLDKLKT